MERPCIHILVKIDKIRILGDRFVERFPTHAHAQHLDKSGFSDTDVASHSDEFFHVSSIKNRAANFWLPCVFLLWDFSSQFLVYHLFENIQRLCSHHCQSVDKEGGRGTHPQIDCEITIFLDRCLICMVCQARLKLVLVEA